MSVASLTADCQSNVNDTTVEHPSFERAVELFNLLDGKNRTILSLNKTDYLYMLIGGGKDGKYFIVASTGEDNFVSPVIDQNLEGSTLLCIGGQEGDMKTFTLPIVMR